MVAHERGTPNLREFPGTPRNGTPFWEASHTIPINSWKFMGSRRGSLMGKGYHFWGHLEIPLTNCQWLFLVPLKGGRLHITPQLAIYKWYISGIYCQLGDYMPPIPPFRGTRNNH